MANYLQPKVHENDVLVKFVAFLS